MQERSTREVIWRIDRNTSAAPSLAATAGKRETNTYQMDRIYANVVQAATSDSARYTALAQPGLASRCLAAIDPWRHGRGYRVPGEFVIVAAAAPGDPIPAG